MAKQPQPQMKSQAQAQSGPRGKILRIGVILGDKIVEERLIRDRAAVTIGQSSKNTFAVPASELPRSWALFQLVAGKYVLNIAENMDGRISDGGNVMTVAQMKSGGKATRQGGAWQMPLSDGARGKIVIGDMTLLFQFVQAPPLQPRPQLPHSVRGSVADQIDPYLAVILAVSLVVHGMIFGYAKFFVDEPIPQPADVIPEQFARVVMERPKPPEPVKDDAKKNEEAKKEEKKDDKKGDEKKPEKKVEKTAPTEAEIKAKVENSAPIHAMQLAFGKSTNGQAIATTDDKVAWGDLHKGLQKVGSDPNAQIGTTGSQKTLGTGTGEVAVGDKTGVTGPNGPGKTTAEKVEKEIKTAISSGHAETNDEGGNGLDPDAVSKTIKNMYQSSVMTCYRNALKANPNLGGKLTVTFTVGIGGTVTKAHVSGFDTGVSSCVEQEARRWRFSPKPSAATEFEFPFELRRM